MAGSVGRPTKESLRKSRWCRRDRVFEAVVADYIVGQPGYWCLVTGLLATGRVS